MGNEAALNEFLQIVKESSNIVFFGGAGVSTESGIPDFRSTDGLYNQEYDFPPETILSHTFFERDPKEFYRFYRDKILIKGAKPNITHIKLAELEKAGKLKAVITQNIDGLHQAAGSKEVYEVHGTVAKNRCVSCNKFFTGDEVRAMIDSAREKSTPGKGGRRYGIPCCDKCGAIIKPEVVLYEEGLDDYTWMKAEEYVSKADVLIVGGTSLVVYPAAGLINYYRGSKLILINRSATPYDSYANLVLNMKLGDVFSRIEV